MNRFIKLFVLISVMFLFTNVCYSTEKAPEKVEIAKGVYLEHYVLPNICDRLLVVDTEKSNEKGNKDYKLIFMAVGKEIKEVKPLDIDSDGKNEYFVSMFTGGSGGFYDVAVIKEDNQGKWSPIWENSFAQPSIEINNNEGKTTIKIEHYERITDVPQKVTSVINYENGKFINQ